LQRYRKTFDYKTWGRHMERDVDLPSRRRTGAQAVAQIIAAQDRPVVYGIPGGYTMHIYDALHAHQDKVRVFLLRQESVATVMAEAQGRLTGNVAFVIAQGAWALGNASVGIMEAHLGASPMVILIDATDGGAYSHLGPYQGGLGGYGSYDLPAAMKAITKQTFVAADATQALQMTQLAIKHATTGEPGPVAVIFQGSALFDRIAPERQPKSYPDRSYAGSPLPVAASASIENAAQLVRQSVRPVVIAGNGVRLAKAEPQLEAFAHALNIPVAATPAGKGVFAENDALALGIIGPFGHEGANEVVGNADLIVAIGTKLGATDTANANPRLIDLDRQKLLQIDVEPLNLSWTFPADSTILGDAKDALVRLCGALAGYQSDGLARVQKARDTHGFFNRAFSSTPGSLSARDLLRILSEHLPEDAVATCDAGENRLFMLRDFQSRRHGTVLQPNGGGGMGYAIPAAMAAAVNFPGRTVVAVCGDGGFSMSLHSLVSAVELGLDFTVLVLNNTVLGWVHNGQRDRVIASQFKHFNYADIAASVGAAAYAVDSLDGFKDALTEIKTKSGVKVIVASTTKADNYKDVMSSLNTSDTYAVPPGESP